MASQMIVPLNGHCHSLLLGECAGILDRIRSSAWGCCQAQHSQLPQQRGLKAVSKVLVDVHSALCATLGRLYPQPVKDICGIKASISFLLLIKLCIIKWNTMSMLHKLYYDLYVRFWQIFFGIIYTFIPFKDYIF